MPDGIKKVYIQWLPKKDRRRIDFSILLVILSFFIIIFILMMSLKVHSYERYECIFVQNRAIINQIISFENCPDFAYVIVGDGYSKVQIDRVDRQDSGTIIYLKEQTGFDSIAGVIELNVGKENLFRRLKKYL